MCDTPVSFKRGSTFAFAFQIPEQVPDGYLSGWLPTAQLRKARNDGPTGLIADLECFWDVEDTARRVIVRHTMTDKWPVGPVELDIRFNSVDGETIQSTTVKINIIRGITR